MVHFRTIRKTWHYIKNHQRGAPWSEVTDKIFRSAKIIRKKHGKYELEDDECYILIELKNGILYVINAKRKK